MNRDELKQRLDALSAKLVEKGYVDVKFHADYTAGFDKVAEDAITVLEAVLAGRTTPMPPLGDSVRSRRPPDHHSNCHLVMFNGNGVCTCGDDDGRDS